MALLDCGGRDLHYLYIVKGIPFKAFLYGLYVVIAIMGYFKWQKMMKEA